MTDELDAVWNGTDPATPSTATPRRCRRHVWTAATATAGSSSVAALMCLRCGRPHDAAASRRGKNNRNRGNAIERWVCRMLGITRVGQYGGKEDGGTSRDWIRVQVKSGVGYPKTIDRWLRAIPTEAGQMAGVVITDAPGPGRRRRALLIVDLYDAASQWGGGVTEEEGAA